MKLQVGLPILFRKFPAGDLVILLPTVPGDTRIEACMSYQHGELTAVHLTATIHQTARAEQEECQQMLGELKKLYPQNDLIAYKTHQPFWFAQMRARHLDWVIEAINPQPMTLEQIADYILDEPTNL